MLLCAALLTCSGCATSNWHASQKPPPPIDCDADALERCETPELDPVDANLGDSEEVDAVNRPRWERCIHRHNAALACFDLLRKAGVLREPAPP